MPTSQMSPADFAEAFVALYRRARTVELKPEKITRARARSVSSELEELIAAYIITNSHEDLHIYVDQPVTLSTGKTQYPDLVVLNKRINQVIAIADIKTDIGWNRGGMEDMCSKLASLRGGLVSTGSIKLGPEPKQRKPYSVSKFLSTHLVIGAAKNSGDEFRSAEAIEIAKRYGTAVYVLTEGKHPNDFSRQSQGLFPGLFVRKEDLSSLVSNVSKVQSNLSLQATASGRA